MSTTAFRVLVCWAVVLGALITGVALIGGADLALGQEDDARMEGFDEVRTTVFIHENGSATFNVDYQYRLDDEANGSPEEWEALKADIEDREEAYLAAEQARWQETLADAENETDREMQVSDFAVETDESSTPREYGHVRFSFEWHSFAHVELNRIQAGDALAGYVLDEDTSLRFSWPESYNATEIEPAPDNRRDSGAVWSGEETEFVDGEPFIDVIQDNANDEEADDEDDEAGTENGEANDDQTDGTDGVSSAWFVVAGLTVFVLALLVGAAGWWVRQNGTGGTPLDVGTESDSQTESSRPPPELLSNEERVLQLLDERGGRIKQQEVVSTLDWTEAKTSQVVGSLREDGEIEVFRIGRENVLAFPSDETEPEP